MFSIEIVGAIVAFVLLVAWAIRVESMTYNNKEQIKEVKDSHNSTQQIIWAKIDMMQGTLTAILQSVAKLEERSQKSDK